MVGIVVIFPVLNITTSQFGLVVSSYAIAARAGLKLSDLIVAIDGQTIDDPNGFDYRFATRPLGGASQIDVQRGGKTVKLTIPLETAPDVGRARVGRTVKPEMPTMRCSSPSPVRFSHW